jgi:hypothetical protein
MGWKIWIEAGNGQQIGAELPEDFMEPGDDEPTALEVMAKFAGEMAEEHRRWGLNKGFGFRAPLTIRIQEI